MGWSAFGRQHNVMERNLLLPLKGKVYNKCILSVLTYESETWTLMKTLERILQSAERGMERIILGIT